MNFFIVTSCIRAGHSAINNDDRYNQTIKTLDSIREQIKGVYILFADSSTTPLTDKEKEEIVSKVDVYLDFNRDEGAQNINRIPNIHQVKSLGEAYMLYHSMNYLKQNFDLEKLNGRMYKFGGRCVLEEGFDISEHEKCVGKYIFKERKSWKGPGIYLIDTRMYSWCLTLVDEYMDIISNDIPKLVLEGHDTEHAHFIAIPKEKLVEFEKLHVGCVVALTGLYVSD